MLPLAELPDPQSPAAIGWLLVAIGALCLALNQGADFIGRFRKKDTTTTEISGQPIVVAEQVTHPTRAECDKRHQEIRDELARHSASRKTIYNELEARAGALAKLQSETTQLATAVGELRDETRENGTKIDTVVGEMKVINQQVQQLVTLLLQR